MIRVLCLTATIAVAQTAVVPFVGCSSNGQLGPEPPPKGQSKTIQADAETAKQLAYYETAQGAGILAPRGWHCFGTGGSGATSLVVSPTPIDTANWFGRKQRQFPGPGIHRITWFGGTSGRFTVADIVARVFPAHRSFAEEVKRAEPVFSLPDGPYPRDVLTYKSNTVVEFETPANTEGLGTQSLLLRNNSPISGVVILTSDSPPDVHQVSVRLSPGQERLAKAIVRQVEAEFAKSVIK